MGVISMTNRNVAWPASTGASLASYPTAATRTVKASADTPTNAKKPSRLDMVRMGVPGTVMLANGSVSPRAESRTTP